MNRRPEMEGPRSLDILAFGLTSAFFLIIPCAISRLVKLICIIKILFEGQWCICGAGPVLSLAT